MSARLIEINGVKYATGLEWNSFDYDGKTRLDMEINTAARKSGKDWGCKLLHVNDRKQLGFGTKELKGYVALGAVLARTFKELLYVKILNEEEFYICYLDNDGLVASDYEGVFNGTELLNKIQTISGTTSQLNIAVSAEDQENIFDEDDDFNYKIINFDEIVKNFRKTPDDIIDRVVQEDHKIKYIMVGTVIAALAGGSYFLFSKPKPEYDEIINHEIASPLDRKANALKVFFQKEQPAIETQAYMNKGKIVVKNKVETSIYEKKELISHIKDLYAAYPPILNEWVLSQIRFDKLKNDSDIKFSIVLNRLPDSYGFYSEAETVTRELSKALPLFNIKVFPADTSNDVLIADFYFKEPKEVLSEKEFQEKIAKLNKEQADIQASVSRTQTEIGEIELNVQANTGYFKQRFGSYLEEVAEDITSKVSVETRKIDGFIKKYKELQNYKLEIPEEYTAGTRLELLNTAQQNSYYQWKVDVNSKAIPEKEQNDKSPNYTYYARSYDFAINSKNVDTKGLEALNGALNLIDKPYYNIYGIQYDINNEQWIIKGEMYEKK